MPGRVQVALDSRRLGLLSRPPNSRRTPGTSRLPLPGLRPRAVNPVRTASWRLAQTGAGATLEEQGRRRAWARCEDCIGRDVIPMGSEGHEESETVARAPVIGVPRGPATAAVRGCGCPWLLGRSAYFTAGPTLSKIVETSLDSLTILISVLAPSRGRARRGPSNRAGPRPQSVHPRGLRHREGRERGCHRGKGDTGRRCPEHPGSVGHLWGVLPVTRSAAGRWSPGQGHPQRTTRVCFK
jgi:hypothetical protein